MANHGLTAVLFTLGPNHTVQQYEMSPPSMVKNVQYLPMLPPPVPTKITQNGQQLKSHSIPGTAPPMPVSRTPEPMGGPVSLSTIQRTTNELHAIEYARQQRAEMSSPTVSTRSMTESLSSQSTNPYHYQRSNRSVSSRGASGTTFSTISPSMVGRESIFSGGSSAFPNTASMISSNGRRSKGSRLRQEVVMSPEGSYVDLFPRTRARLSNVTYKQPQALDQENATADDLRKQMLDVVFGWEDDIESLVRDELAHHQPGSTSAVLLSKWLGDVDTDQMAAAIGSGNINSSDWMLLALSQMGGQASMGKMGQAFVQRLLQQGDFHTSATILLGMGDREDAVEVYVSRSFFMEAILLTCLVFPTDWQRQAHLVRRWGEFVVENSQQQLAIRCFSCTGVEPPVPWASPSMSSHQGTPSQSSQSVASMISPPISPPPALKPTPSVRMTTKNSSLKVITSFGVPDKAQFKFPGLKSDDRTPTNGPGVTPIAESAISPGGTPGGFLRPSARGKSNFTSRTVTPGGYQRNRLPSIGETPVDEFMPSFSRPSSLPTPDNSESDLEKERRLVDKAHDDKVPQDATEPPLLLSSARYNPGSAVPGKSPMTALPTTAIPPTVLPDPSQDPFTAFREKEKSRLRNASRDRKPDGLHIQMPPQSQIQTTYISSAGTGSVRSDHRRSNTLSSMTLNTNGSAPARHEARSETKSPPPSGQSWTSATKSPSASGRSIDQYISSLDEAGYHSRKRKSSSRRRHKSREGRSATNGEHKSRSKNRIKDSSEDRGRVNQKYIRPAKRSPSSPVPMSPEDIDLYRDNATIENVDAQLAGFQALDLESRNHRKQSNQPKSVSKLRSGSKASENSSRTVRRISPDGFYDSQLGSEASYNPRSKVGSRQPSPNGLLYPNGRGRSKSKNGGGSSMRSPSSPLPMSDQSKFYQRSEDEDDPLRLVDANRQRIRSRQRSSSRKPRERGASSRRDGSPDRRRPNHSRNARGSNNGESMREPQSAIEPRAHSGDIYTLGANHHREKLERAQKKELAAAELEARRMSLAQRTEAPQIPHPTDISNQRPPMVMRSQTDLGNSPTTWGNPLLPQHNQRIPTTTAGGDYSDVVNRAASVGPYGLPATPRAMRHPKYDFNHINPIPAVPEIPDSLQNLSETYYTGQPMRELPRSMSAPIPTQEHPPLPADLPSHPAFHKALRSSNKRSNFSPLGDIGQHRRRPSQDASAMTHPSVTPGIYETLHAADSVVKITTIEEPPLLPELQHLSAIPPPPPPPPAFPGDTAHHSASSGSGLGVISIAIDDQSRGDDSHVIDVPPLQLTVQNARSPPPAATRSPPPTVMVRTNSNHRRGRSDNFKNNVKSFTDRLRSTSRGRNNAKSPHMEQTNEPSPYESVPPLYF